MESSLFLFRSKMMDKRRLIIAHTQVVSRFKSRILNTVLLCIPLTLLCANAHAQKEITADSMVNRSIELFDSNPDESFSLARKAYKLALAQSDKKIMMDALNEIGSHYLVRGNFDSSIIFYEQGLEISKVLKDQSKAAGILHNLGLIYDQIGKLDKALSNFREALLINQKINRKWMAFNLGAIGNVYLKLGNNAEAIRYKYDALRISEQLGDDETVADEIGSIALIHDDLKEYDKSVPLHFRALSLYKKIGSQRGISNVYNNLSVLYLKTGRKDLAKYYGNEALKLNRELDDLYAISCTLHGLAEIYLASGEADTALKYVKEAYDLALQTGSERREAISATLLGEIYTTQKKYEQARTYFNRALALARPEGILQELSTIYLDLSRLDSIQGHFSSSLENYKQYVICRDSILNEKNIRSLTSQMMTHEFEKVQSEQKAKQEQKDQETSEELRRQKTIRNTFLGGFGLMLVFAVIFLMQRNKINAEKKRSDELLVNILPREVADELKAKGEAEAKLFDEVTVLFTDFKGFTTLAETLSPKELVRDLHDCFTAFDNIMHKHGLEKIKTIGDAYMAAGGLPVPGTTHAKDVVTAALEILNFMEEEKAKKKAAGQLYFEIRIGVHTGPVVAGIVGVKKFSYDIWGDTVNTASRMESSGEAGKVNISGTTYELVKDQFHCTHRGKVSAKNKGEIDMYFVEV